MSKENDIKRAKLYVARKCGQGSKCACTAGRKIFAAESIRIMAGSMASLLSVGGDSGHPNRLPFKGVLLTLDESSTKPPHGSRGHRIYVPTEVARKHLDGLVGMAVNYDPDDLDSHETRHKVGIITKAGIKGKQVWVKGFIWKKDFPEAVGRLTGRRDLGMSMELANVYVRDEHEDVWHLEDFEFTGATILKKSAAAYYSTELSATSDRKNTVLAAIAAAASGKKHKGEVMSQTKAKGRVAAASNSGGSNAALLVDALKGAMGEAISPLVTELRAANDRSARIQEDLEELKGLHLIQASAHEDDDDDEEMSAHSEEEDDDDDEMEAGKDKGKKEEDDDEDDDADDDSEGEDDDLSAELEDMGIDPAEEEPGEVNTKGNQEGDVNKGDKTTVTDPPTQKEHMKGNIAKKRLQSAASKKSRPFPGLKSAASIQAAAIMVQTMQARMEGLKRKNRQLVEAIKAAAVKNKKVVRKMQTQLDTLQAQVERHAESVDRRSSALPIEIRNLLAKANVDPREIQAGAAEKLTTSAVDRVFSVLAAEGVNIEPVKRAEYKNRMVELGLMENGEERYGVQ